METKLLLVSTQAFPATHKQNTKPLRAQVHKGTFDSGFCKKVYVGKALCFGNKRAPKGRGHMYVPPFTTPLSTLNCDRGLESN